MKDQRASRFWAVPVKPLLMSRLAVTRAHYRLICEDPGAMADAGTEPVDAVDIGNSVHPHPGLGERIDMTAEVEHGS